MTDADSIFVLAEYSSSEIKIKGSRFIAEAHPVPDEDTAKAIIGATRKREYNATHHCTAYRIGDSGDISRFNDDGEPSGTAGMPILRQIASRNLTNTLVIVVRYYGGTKLGTGGLIRAYGQATSDVLNLSKIETVTRRTPVNVRFSYTDTSPALHTIGLFDVKIAETRYGDDTTMDLEVRNSEVERFLTAFRDALSGRGLMVFPDDVDSDLHG